MKTNPNLPHATAPRRARHGGARAARGRGWWAVAMLAVVATGHAAPAASGTTGGADMAAGAEAIRGAGTIRRDEAAAGVETAPGSLGERLLRGYIGPAAQRLVDAARANADALDAHCARPGDAALRETLDRRFGALAEAWGGVEFLRFGPLVEGNRFERFFFFPDPRGVVQRQLGAALAAADPALLEAGALAHESVALQGMPALEYALYGNGAEAIPADPAAGRYRCAYARAVAANLAAVAEEFARAWQYDGALAREFAAPSADARLYRTPAEVTAEALKAVSGGLQYVRDVKLVPALGATPEQARGQRAPLWRSARTIDLLRGNVAGLQAFIEAAGFTPLLPEDQRWIPGSLADEAARALDAMQTVTLPFDRAVKDSEQHRALEYLVLLLKNLQDITDQNLAPAVGVNLGFNAFDGD